MHLTRLRRDVSLVPGRVGLRCLLRHTFSGASLTPSDQGPSFSTISGTASVGSGVLTKVGATNLEVRAHGLAANITYQARFNFGASAGANRRMLLRARQDASTGDNRFQLTINRVAGQLVLARVDSGTPTTIGSVSVTIANSTDYWLRWVMRGSTHEVLFSTDGTTWSSQIVVTDATYTTQTSIGVFVIDDAASPTATIDDLLVWTP